MLLLFFLKGTCHLTMMGLAHLALFLSLSYSDAARSAADFEAMKKDVQAIVEARTQKYNCTFSVAVKAPSLDSAKVLPFVAGGATAASKFAWGSITKMWTGASIMQLVAKGVVGLDQPAAPLVDAQLAAMKRISFPGMNNFTRLRDLYGPDVEKVTIHNLLHMQSGASVRGCEGASVRAYSSA